MKIVRLAGLVLVAVMALSLAAVSAASAEEPFFLPTTGTFTATGGTAKLVGTGGAEVITCLKSNTSNGSIVTRDLVRFSTHFLECTYKAGTTECSAMSPGAPLENLILTKTLHGILGLALPNTPALLILPESGAEFVKLLGTCFPTATVTGNVVGEISPTGSKQATGKLTLTEGVSQHFIASLGGLTAAKLLGLGAGTNTEITEAAIAWGQETEVMP